MRRITIISAAFVMLAAGSEILAQQMPTPKPGDMGEIIRLDPALDDVIAPGTTIEKVPGSWGTLPGARTEGPVWKFLYITNGLKWMRYEVQRDGTLGTGTVHIDLSSQRDTGPGGPDGMKIDKAGNLFATGPGGVWIISPEGKPLGRIRLPIYAMNDAFGGKDGKTLYMTAWTNIYRLRVKTGGKLP